MANIQAVELLKTGNVVIPIYLLRNYKKLGINIDEFNKNFSAIGIRDTSVFTLTKSTNKKKQAYIYDAFDFDYQTIENMGNDE